MKTRGELLRGLSQLADDFAARARTGGMVNGEPVPDHGAVDVAVVLDALSTSAELGHAEGLRAIADAVRKLLDPAKKLDDLIEQPATIMLASRPRGPGGLEDLYELLVAHADVNVAAGVPLDSNVRRLVAMARAKAAVGASELVDEATVQRALKGLGGRVRSKEGRSIASHVLNAVLGESRQWGGREREKQRRKRAKTRIANGR